MSHATRTAKGRKKKWIKSVVVNLPQYGIYVTGLLGWTPEHVRYFFLKKFECESPVEDEPDGRCITMNHPREGFHIIVYLSRWDKQPETIALLSHECLHATMSILDMMGQAVCTKEHEHVTWLHQHIFQELWKGRLRLEAA